MMQLRTVLGLALGAAALAQSMGCGIYGGGGGGGGSKADVMGDISAVNPNDTDRDIVVFVYRVKDEPADCRTPVLPDDNDEQGKEELEDGANTFDIRKVNTGRLVIAFLLDDAGNDADGRIDPGDPVAVLDDPNCILDDVPDDYVVQALDVRINFGLDNVVGMPAPGRAEAGSLSEHPED